MKAQSAVEYLVIVGIGLIILTPILYYSNKSFQNYKEDSNILAAKTTVDKIGENVDWVYSQGYPSRVQIRVYIPENVESTSLVDRTVLIKMESTSGAKDVFYETIGDMQGSIPTKSGFYFLSLVAMDGYVNVTLQ
jgi:hypothetical protein